MQGFISELKVNVHEGEFFNTTLAEYSKEIDLVKDVFSSVTAGRVPYS